MIINTVEFITGLGFLWKTRLLCIITRYTVHGRGAKSPLGSNYQVTTTSKKFTILSKKCPKSGPKPDQTLIDFPNGTNTSACFEQFFSKLGFLVFQIYTVQFHLSTPHMPLLKITKNPDKIRTNWNSSFRLAHERKGASRNKHISKLWK